MELRLIERAADAFQESISADQILAMCERAFGTGTEVVSVVELGGGSYNNTYRVDIGEDRPVILRVAPAARQQTRLERSWMRKEHASLPFFAPIAAMMPRTLFADWTHEIIRRDYIWQTMLDGVPAADTLKDYPRPQWTSLYRQLGLIAKQIHGVRGERFGQVGGPDFSTWSEAVISSLADTAADLADAGLAADDLREVIVTAEQNRSVLDEITEPRLLHGDLWVPNLMLAPGAPEPTIIGVLDHDRVSWGDPAADWIIYVVGQRAERDPFWETYGPQRNNIPGAAWRALFYRAQHIGAVRLERHRMRRDDRMSASYEEMRVVLDGIGASVAG